jgi:ribonuclease T2
LLDHPQLHRLVIGQVVAMGMPLRSRIISTLAALAAAIATPLPALSADFDFYVLSLSWSPSWCAAEDPGGRTAQCDGRRPYRFIAHGLWPQNERGWPEYCPSSEPERVPDSLARAYRDIIPSAGLAGHEWRKHGSCSGLAQKPYFDTLRAAYAKVRLPPVVFDGRIDRRLDTDAIERLMISANPGLSPKAVAIDCEGGKLTEIRICLTKSLGFRSCDEVDRNACRQRTVLVPALR